MVFASSKNREFLKFQRKLETLKIFPVQKREHTIQSRKRKEAIWILKKSENSLQNVERKKI